jgi:hypothetical protein
MRIELVVGSAIFVGAAAGGCAKHAAPPGPLSVAGVNPPDGSMNNQPTATTVSATLSATIDCSTVTDASLQVVQAGSPVAGHVTCADAMLSFQPTGQLPSKTALVATLDGEVRDTEGVALGTAVSWMFAMAPWAIQLGTPKDDQANGIVVSGSTVYIAGTTSGSLAGNANAGSTDAFVASYSTTGATQWIAQLGTGAADEANGIALDGAGGVYVVGSTSGALDGNTNAGGVDAFVAKYDAAGALQWARQLGSDGDDYGTAVAVDHSGNVYVAGYSNSSFVATANVGGNDLFVARLDAAGNLQWIREYGSTGNDYATGIATDGAGNVYVVGFTDGGLDGTTSAGNDDLFAVRFDPTGFRIWTRQFGTRGFDVARGLAIDANNQIFIAGYTNGGAASGYDAWLLEYDTSGGINWGKELVASADAYTFGIALDGNGHIDLVGATNGAFDGNTTAGDADAFIAQYDTSGTFMWVTQFGTGGADQAYGVATDAAGNAYVAGKTNGGLDGNSNAGGYDAFVAAFGQNGDSL